MADHSQTADVAPELLARAAVARPGGNLRQVATGNPRITLWRLAWDYTGYGRGLSTLVERRIVQWFAYADGALTEGSRDTKRGALEFAEYTLALADKYAKEGR
jgi:hypothetical protein